MKDDQQLDILNTFVEKYNLPVNIVRLATVRENSGIAKSSLNIYLSDHEKHLANSIYTSINYGAELIKSKEYNAKVILDNVRKKILETSNIDYEYIELLSIPDLEDVTEVNSTIALAIAVKYSKARLIDNLIINKYGEVITKFN